MLAAVAFKIQRDLFLEYLNIQRPYFIQRMKRRETIFSVRNKNAGKNKLKTLQLLMKLKKTSSRIGRRLVYQESRPRMRNEPGVEKYPVLFL